jgi:Aromatic-ring-opening dioxygenase LigAB, LigA subunit
VTCQTPEDPDGRAPTDDKPRQGLDIPEPTVVDGEGRGAGLKMSARDANPYEISRLLYSLRVPANREAVRTDPEAYYRRFAIGADGMRLLLDRDWQGLVDAGVSVYLLTKLGAALSVSLLQMGAAMRGINDGEFRRFIEEQNERNRPLAVLPSATEPEKPQG